MKKNVLQKLIAVALTGAIAIGTLAGCGNSGKTEDAPASAETTVKEEKAAEEKTAEEATPSEESNVAGIDGWTAFEENVTLKIPVYDRGVEGVPAIGENYWEQWIQENFADKYNITMEFVPITRSDVLTSYSLLAADSDLPTILMEYDYPKLAQWAADGYLTTYDIDAFAQVAPTYYNRMVELGQISYTELNGDCFFALAERPFYNTNYTWVTMYRQDWAEQVGYSEWPQTWEEEKDMLLKIKEAGICEYPAFGRMIVGAGQDLNHGFRSYPLDEANWAMYGDYAIPALGDAANKAYVKIENEKYNLGLLNPEYYVTDEETAKSRFINGEMIEYSGYISANMDWLTAFYEQNPDADLAIKVIKEVDPESGRNPGFRANNPYGMMIGFSSMASEDEIKAAWMYMEWMTLEENLFTMQWGLEGEHYTVDEKGLPVGIGDYSGDKTQGYNNSKDYWCVTIEARQAGTIEDIIAASSPAGLPEDFTQEILDQYNTQIKLAGEGYAVSDCNFAVVIESVGEYQATLLELYTVLRDELTMCDPAEFDAKYEEAAKEYAEAGFQAIVDERKAAYDAGMTTTLQ